MFDDIGTLVTTDEAGEMRGVSGATIRRYIRQGRLEVVLRFGRTQLLRASDVESLERPKRGRPVPDGEETVA